MTWKKGGNGQAPLPPLLSSEMSRCRLVLEVDYTSKRPAARTFFHDGLFR